MAGGLNSVASQFRPKVRKIIQSFPITIEEAFQHLLLNEFDVERVLNILENQEKSRRMRSERSMDRSDILNTTLSQEDSEENQQEAGSLYNKYAKTMKNHEKYPFYQMYKLNIELIKSKQKVEQDRFFYQNDFYQALSHHLKQQSILNNQYKTFQEALCVAYHERAPILLLLSHRMDKRKLGKFYSSRKIIKKIRNQFVFFASNFKSFVTSQPITRIFKKGLDFNNQITIFRIDIHDELRIIGKINLENEIQQIFDEIKKAKVKCSQDNLNQQYFRFKFLKLVQQGVRFKLPLNFEQRIKFREQKRKQQSNRRLRANQQLQYQKLEQQIRKKQQTVKELKQTISLQQLTLRRQKIRSQLKIYEKGLNFKIRLPSQKNIFLIVDPSEKVDYFYRYLQSVQEKIGFEDEINRPFSIFVGLGISNCLDNSKDKQISSLFEEDSFLVIQEKY